MRFTMYAIRSRVEILDTTSDRYYAIARMIAINSHARAHNFPIRVYVEKLTRG